MELKQWKDVLSIIHGKDYKAVANTDGKYPVYGSGGLMGYADDYLCEAGTTIIGRKGTINKPIFVNEPFWNIDTAFGLVAGPDLDQKYLFFFCEYFNFLPLDKSTGRPSLAKSDLLKIQMPVPTIIEQKRIVSRIEELLSQLETGEETLKKIKAQLAVYRQAVLKEAFDNLDAEKEVTFGSLMSVVRNGYGLKPDDSGEYRILRIGAVRSMKIDLTDYRLNKTEFSYEDIIHENDLLFTRYNGSREYVGVCACVPRLDVEYAFPDKIIKCTPKLDNTYHSKYLQFYVSQGKARDYIRSKIKTTSGQNGIAGSDIKRILVNLPSIDKQQKIVEKIESRLSVCDSIEQSIDSSLQQAAAMRQSILKQAFEGRL